MPLLDYSHDDRKRSKEESYDYRYVSTHTKTSSPDDVHGPSNDHDRRMRENQYSSTLSDLSSSFNFYSSSSGFLDSILINTDTSIVHTGVERIPQFI